MPESAWESAPSDSGEPPDVMLFRAVTVRSCPADSLALLPTSAVVSGDDCAFDTATPSAAPPETAMPTAFAVAWPVEVEPTAIEPDVVIAAPEPIDAATVGSEWASA